MRKIPISHLLKHQVCAWVGFCRTCVKGFMPLFVLQEANISSGHMSAHDGLSLPLRHSWFASLTGEWGRRHVATIITPVWPEISWHSLATVAPLSAAGHKLLSNRPQEMSKAPTWGKAWQRWQWQTWRTRGVTRCFFSAKTTPLPLSNLVTDAAAARQPPTSFSSLVPSCFPAVKTCVRTLNPDELGFLCCQISGRILVLSCAATRRLVFSSIFHFTLEHWGDFLWVLT